MTTQARIWPLMLLFIPGVVRAQWDYGYHSSTLEEGVQRGAADVVRSYGMANLQNSQAAGQFESARSQYIDNQYKATQAYFELWRYSAEQRRAMDTRPLKMDQYVRLASQQAPDQLTATQLDPLTGSINWPAPLRKPEYDALRRQLDKLTQDRAHGYLSYGEIPKACQEFLDRLKADVMTFSVNDYAAAKKFLESLSYAARNVQT